MDTAILSAGAALVGSLIGGVSTFTGAWLSQRSRQRNEARLRRASKREALYAEFIVEASERYAHAWSHEAESPQVIANLYSVVERMRLISSESVICAAEEVIRDIAEAYAHPNETFEDVRKRLEADGRRNPLREFTQACRNELLN